MTPNPVAVAYLFPCALIEDFTHARLCSSLETEEFNKWSTSSITSCNISLDETVLKNNRKALKISYTSPSTQYVSRGLDGTEYDHSSVNNPLGSQSGHEDADFSDYTNMGAWIYTTTHDQADDADMIKFGYNDTDDNGPTMSNWNSSVGETGKWCWMDEEVDFQHTKVDRFMIGVDSSSSGAVYFNNLVVFKRSTSNKPVYDASDKGSTNAHTSDYTWQNGITFVATNIISSYDSIALNGLILGDDYRDLIKQLRYMETRGVTTYAGLQSPDLMYHSIRDLGKVKTYLFMTEFKGPNDGSANREMYVEPVIITDLNFTHRAGVPHAVQFSCTLLKFTGV